VQRLLWTLLFVGTSPCIFRHSANITEEYTAS
jgi:hypothetical protein